MTETKITITNTPRVSANNASLPGWQWTIEHAGDVFSSGDPITHGGATFYDSDAALTSAGSNLRSYLVSPRCQELTRIRKEHGADGKSV